MSPTPGQAISKPLFLGGVRVSELWTPVGFHLSDSLTAATQVFQCPALRPRASELARKPDKM